MLRVCLTVFSPGTREAATLPLSLALVRLASGWWSQQRSAAEPGLEPGSVGVRACSPSVPWPSPILRTGGVSGEVGEALLRFAGPLLRAPLRACAGGGGRCDFSGSLSPAVAESAWSVVCGLGALPA